MSICDNIARRGDSVWRWPSLGRIPSLSFLIPAKTYQLVFQLFHRAPWHEELDVASTKFSATVESKIRDLFCLYCHLLGWAGGWVQLCCPFYLFEGVFYLIKIPECHDFYNSDCNFPEVLPCTNILRTYSTSVCRNLWCPSNTVILGICRQPLHFAD